MPITTGSNPMAMKPKAKKAKKATVPKMKGVKKPRKPSLKSISPATTLDKLLKGGLK